LTYADTEDASGTTLRIDADLHAPSGESLVRQFAYGMGYARERLGIEPSVVWLPDSFGFPNTFPQIAAHAGAAACATTLQRRERTGWPQPHVVWRADDGSELTAAVIDDRNAASVPPAGRSLADWLAGFDRASLPVYVGELDLRAQRGTYTTHRDVKSRNAALERALDAAEEAAAWCVAVRTGPSVTAPLRDDLRTAWTIVLRNQSRDLIGGTAAGARYAGVHEEYDRAERIAARVLASARSVLPRAQVERVPAPACLPREDDGTFVLENEVVRARVRRDGIITELAANGGPNVATLANALCAYRDRPMRQEAANLDAGYERRPIRVRPQGAVLEDGGIVVRLRIGTRSTASMRIELRDGEPYVRVELAVAWHEDRTLLRVEHRLAVAADSARFGMPHGTIARPLVPTTAAERANFEVPAQRFALVDDGERGCAMFAPDTYGWNARGLRKGGALLGMSLLRAPRRPDPAADRGEHRIAYALAPTAGPAISALEEAWTGYVCEPRVRLFTTDDPGVIVVATKPADDGDGVIVRVRECDGIARSAAVRSGARVRGVEAVDGTERAIPGEVTLAGETLRFPLPAFALRSFRVRS
jgi:alpha-mannosidase